MATTTPTEILMPNLGFDTQEAELVEWLKQPGDAVQKGEIIAIVESDKANVELESVASGVLLEQRYQGGQTVPVGDVIGTVGPPAAAPAEGGTGAGTVVEASPLARRVAADHGVDLSEVAGSGPRGRIGRRDVEAFLEQQEANGAPAGDARGIRALPKVRKMAREQEIDLTRVPPTGPGRTITVADLQAYGKTLTEEQAAAPAPEPAAGDIAAQEGVRHVELSRIRQASGRRLGESMRQAPHFYVTAELDVEAALERLNEMPEPRPGINDLLQYLTVQTLQRVPQLNAVFRNEQLYHYDSINLAIAVARDDGLITPVLRNAARYSLSGLATESRALIQRARDNRLQPEDLQEGTFTISNLGIVRQVDRFTAVINPPQVAILAVGAVRPRPVVVAGGLHVRHTVHLTLSGDHRVVDGMDLGQFMAAFEEELTRFSL